MDDHKHRFKYLGVEDYFLYKQLRFSCRVCFTECYVERKEFYSILTEVPKLWR